MNLVELYQQTPADEHGSIRVVGNRVLVDQQGAISEYLIEPDGELWLLPSPTAGVAAAVEELKQQVAEIKTIVSGQ